MIPAFSTIGTTAHCGARVRCSRPLGTRIPQSDGTIRQIDQELVFQDEIELVIILVALMPMVFSLHYAQAHD